METTINFGGFYESIHDCIVDEAIASDIGVMDDEWSEGYEKIAQASRCPYLAAYGKEYINKLNSETNTNIIFSAIKSPQFYNFSTDTIEARVSTKDSLALFRYIRENELFNELESNIRNMTTRQDGFIPFYSYSDIMKKENRGLLNEALLNAIIDDLSNDGTFMVDDFSHYE